MHAHLNAGAGLPVALIAQLGTSGSSWTPVIDLLPGASIFTYDRPGTGQAPGRAAPNPPLPVSAFAQELAADLDEAGIAGPAVIVGHSFGGNIAKAFAGLFPEQVAGLVFVDSSIPQTFLHPETDPMLDGDGPDATEINTVRSQVEIMTLTLPRVPTAVLTRTPGSWDGQYDPPHPDVEDLWITSQRALAQQTSAALLIADACGHQIPRDNPALVAYAIQEVTAAVVNRRDTQFVETHLNSVNAHLDGN